MTLLLLSEDCSVTIAAAYIKDARIVLMDAKIVALWTFWDPSLYM